MEAEAVTKWTMVTTLWWSSGDLQAVLITMARKSPKVPSIGGGVTGGGGLIDSLWYQNSGGKGLVLTTQHDKYCGSRNWYHIFAPHIILLVTSHYIIPFPLWCQPPDEWTLVDYIIGVPPNSDVICYQNGTTPSPQIKSAGPTRGCHHPSMVHVIPIIYSHLQKD